MPQGVLAARSVGVVLAGLWTALAAAVVIGYRPGGPADPLVGLATLVPCVVATAAVIWPPFDQDRRASAAFVWLGIASALLTVPLLTGILEVLAAGGRQTLLPSPEVAYAAALALLTTCLFAALGLARRWLPAAPLISRARVAGLMAAGLALAGGTLFGTAALANEQALRERPAPSSAWGPTDTTVQPPRCDEPVLLGPGAQVDVSVTAVIDLDPVASASMTGLRQGSDESWTARRDGLFGAGTMSWSHVGAEAWLTEDDGPPRLVTGDHYETYGGTEATLDGPVLAAISDPDALHVTQEIGLESFDGALARHCRRAMGGTLAIDAVLAMRWLASQPLTLPSDALEAWRGEVDWWVFGDGQLGRAALRVSGYPGDAWATTGISATLEATMTALHRDRVHDVEHPPLPAP